MRTSEIKNRLGFELWQLRIMCLQRSKRTDFDVSYMEFCEFEDYKFHLSKKDFLGRAIEDDILHIKASCTLLDEQQRQKVKQVFEQLEKVIRFANTAIKIELLPIENSTFLPK